MQSGTVSAMVSADPGDQLRFGCESKWKLVWIQDEAEVASKNRDSHTKPKDVELRLFVLERCRG